MVISPKVILKLGDRVPLVSNLGERDLFEPEGLGFDLRVGEVFAISGEGFLGVEDRDTPPAQAVTANVVNGRQQYSLPPGAFILVRTMETVALPSSPIFVEELGASVWLLVTVLPRSTLQRCGVLLLATKVDPGYNGALTFGLANLGGCPFRVERGGRIANIVFHSALGEAKPYGGQWNGGRVATESRERQV